MSSPMTMAAKTSARVARLLSRRLQYANGQCRRRMPEVAIDVAPERPRPQHVMQTMADALHCVIDAVQRSVLAAEALRETGNNFIADEQAGKRPRCWPAVASRRTSRKAARIGASK